MMNFTITQFSKLLFVLKKKKKIINYKHIFNEEKNIYQRKGRIFIYVIHL